MNHYVLRHELLECVSHSGIKGELFQGMSAEEWYERIIEYSPEDFADGGEPTGMADYATRDHYNIIENKEEAIEVIRATMAEFKELWEDARPYRERHQSN
jgi:hypothetical protein